MKIKMGMILVLLYTELSMVANPETTQDHAITIFVHGTYLFRKLLQFSSCRPLMYCPQGLTLAKNLPKHYHFHQIAHGCASCDRNLYSVDQFYVFGWPSEHVSDTVRNQAAKILVEQIYELVVDYYVRHEIIPMIRLIGFSHGGNVILHTANYFPLYADMQDLQIEAWLFGTPVQVVNHDLVNSDCFTAIYSIFSKKDIVQVIDPQGLRHRKLTKNNFWSNRTFAEHARCIQVDFTVAGQAIGHSFYNSIFQYFPRIKKIIEEKSMHLNYGMITVDFKI